MPLFLPTELLHVPTSSPAPATVHRGVDAGFLASTNQIWRTAFDGFYQEALKQGVPRALLPVHAHWDWERKERVTRAQQALFVAVECANATQGLMMVTFHKTCRLAAQFAEPLIYVEYLESAPWNIEPLINVPRYRAVGSVLLEQAVLISKECGFEGRIGLHSLPQADGFYARNMTDLGIDTTVENLRYFEMTPQQTVAFLEK